MLLTAVTLPRGKGCPVYVTPLESIDAAIPIAARPGVTFCSFGEMLRVLANDGDLLLTKAQGADVRMVHSPIDALKTARDMPGQQVVFFAVGLETNYPDDRDDGSPVEAGGHQKFLN